jgi:hypothetical protein
VVKRTETAAYGEEGKRNESEKKGQMTNGESCYGEPRWINRKYANVEESIERRIQSGRV